MKALRYLHFVCLTSFLMLSKNLYANEMCVSASNAICQNTSQERLIKKNYLNKLQSEIQTKSTSNLTHILKNATAAQKIQINKKKNFYLNKEKIKIAQQTLKSVEKAITNPKYKVELDELFKDQIKKSNFPPVFKQELLAIIAQVTIMDFSSYVEFKDLIEDEEAQSMNPCGSDGLTPNAFSINHLGTLAVVICPGFVIEDSLQIKTEALFEKIIFVLAHEMAHHLDTQFIDEKNYTQFSECLIKNSARELKASSEDRAYCKKNAHKPALCLKQIVYSHNDEIIADAWGLKILAEYMKRKSFSYYEMNHLIEQNFKVICGSVDDGYHPSSEFRIKNLLLAHPEINKSLGCQGIKKPNHCSF